MTGNAALPLMSDSEMLAAVKAAYEVFAQMQLYPGRRYIVAKERDGMAKAYAELKRRAALEKAS